MVGQAVCRMHGGMSPQALAAAQRRLVEQRARAVLGELGEDVEPVTDPLSALENIAGQAVTLVDALKGVVAQLGSIRYESAQGLEQLRG